jgi:hypothetical protein
MIRQPKASFKTPHPIGSGEAKIEAAKMLIERARRHPLGTKFLQDGALDSVAATFEVHAFTVDHARDLLGS